MSYRDRKTGRFVSRSTWKRSKARGGVRFVREIVRSTPREKRATVKRKSLSLPKKPVRDYILTVKIKTRERHRGHTRTREFSRDIVIPAREGASRKELIAIADKYLPEKERYALDWIEQKDSKIIIAEGPQTRRKRAYLR